MSRSTRPPLALVAPSLAASLLSLVPLWYLVDQSFEQGVGRVVDELVRSRTLALVARSALLTASVTVLCVVIGTAAAWLVVRTDLPGRNAWRVALLLPLAIPSYLAAFAWVSWIPSLAGFSGAVLVLTMVSYPYVMLPAMAALSRLDPAHDDVARSLGASQREVFWRIVVPAIRPSVAAGALLVALYVLSDFGAVAAMRYEVFTWVVYGAYRSGFDPSRAAILASVLVAAAAVLVAAEGRVRGRAEQRVGAGAPRAQRAVALGRARVPGLALCGAVAAVALAVPLWRIATWVATMRRSSTAIGDLWEPMWSTARLSAAAGVVTVLLALPVGILAGRHRGRLPRVLERSTYVAHALPGIVIAISLVFVGVRLLTPIYLRSPLLVLGYVVVFLPLAVGLVRAAAERVPRAQESVARSLGDHPMAAVRRVVMPQMLPGIASAVALVVLATVKELPITLVLRPAGTDTLATQLWRHTSVSDYADGGPYALAIVLFAAVPTAVLTAAQARRGADRPTVGS